MCNSYVPCEREEEKEETKESEPSPPTPEREAKDEGVVREEIPKVVDRMKGLKVGEKKERSEEKKPPGRWMCSSLQRKKGNQERQRSW